MENIKTTFNGILKNTTLAASCDVCTKKSVLITMFLILSVRSFIVS